MLSCLLLAVILRDGYFGVVYDSEFGVPRHVNLELLIVLSYPVGVHVGSIMVVRGRGNV